VDDNLQAAAAPDQCAFSMREQVRENCASKFFGAGAAAAALRQCSMTKSKGPAAGGVKKKQVDGDYKKRRKPARSTAARDKAAAATDLAKTAAAANVTKPKPKPAKKFDDRPAPPKCKRGFRMVWVSKDIKQMRGGGIGAKAMAAMMRREQGRQEGLHWVMIKCDSRYI